MGIVNDLAERLELAVVQASSAFESAKKGDPDELIRLYVRANEEYERLDAARKALNSVLENVSRGYIPDLLQERKIKTISLDDIKKRVTWSVRMSASIIPEKKVEAFQWLRAPEQDAGALIQETVNAGTLSSFAKQRLEAGYELPDDLFKTSSMNYTSVTKIK